MNAGEFDRIMGSVENTFSKRVSPDQRMHLWPKLERIPSRYVSEIISRLEDRDESPKNLGKTVLAIWYTLDTAAAREEEHKGCADCDKGTIWSHKGGKSHACPCATCQPGAHVKFTAAQLRAAGHTVDNPKRGDGRPISAERAAWWLGKLRQRLGMEHLEISGIVNRDPLEAARAAELRDRG